MNLEPGTPIGKYVLGRKLGSGGFGVVFRASDASLDREVALKFLHPEHTANPQILQRFLQEARSAAKIMHPGIVTVFECGQMTEANGAAYIAMELLVGESLTDRLARSGRLAPAAAMEVCRQVAAALEAAHRIGIVHRDLKPDNIFIVHDSAMRGGERVKVLDFGIAKLGRAATSSVQTQSMMVFGTPRYMSPEQCKSAANVDHRSDIYTLGAILFELLTGQPPFAGEPGELIAQHLLVPPPTVASLLPSVSDSLDKLVSALLAKKPENRPSTMAAVQLALESDGGEAPGVAPTMAADAISMVHVSTPGALGVRAPADQRVFTGNTDATALPGAVGASRGANPTTLSHATGSSGPALPVAKRGRTAIYAAVGVLLLGAIAGGVALRSGGGSDDAAAQTIAAAPPALAPAPVAAGATTSTPTPAVPTPTPAVPSPTPVAPVIKTIAKAPVAAPVHAMGSLTISSTPSCDIFVDGAPIGMHTPATELPLSVGRHKITLVDAERKIRDTFPVDVKAGNQVITKTYKHEQVPPIVETHEPVAPPPPDTTPKKDGTINPFAKKAGGA